MRREGGSRVPRIEAVWRSEGLEICPYCRRKMYGVPFREDPKLEAHICFACGGCVIYEVVGSPRTGPSR